MNPFAAHHLRCNRHVLTGLTFVFAAITVGTLSLSVATNSWLVTREMMIYKMNETKVQLWISTWSGLWTICMKPDGIDEVGCMRINYDADNSGRDAGAETSMTIIAAMRGSVPLPVTALILAGIAVVLNVMGSYYADVRTLVCAVFYVLTGLALAVGIILYISAINDEVGYRASSKKEVGGFQYKYGWSFFSAGISFMSSEAAAVVNVTLYLKRNSQVDDMMRIIPGLEEKVDSDKLVEEGIHNPTIIL